MKDYIVKRFTDIEGDQNRGWRVDELRLETEDGEEIGYMKLAQIPFKRFKSHYPNILYFFDKIRGWCGFVKYYEENDWQSIANRAHSYDRSIGMSSFEDRDLPDHEWEKKGRLAIKQIEDKYMWQFKNFQLYFVDQPYVDYAQINEKFQRQGFYLKLYYEALKWCKERDLPLYTSSLKSDEAELTFEKYVNEHKIIGNYVYINVHHGRDPDKTFQRFRVTTVML